MLKGQVVFKTFGCKVNQYDSMAMQENLEDAGFKVVEEGDDVKLCVINTCTVTGVSDAKARHSIRKFQDQYPQAHIAVVGCYAEGNPDEIKNLGQVHYVIGTAYKDELADIIDQYPPKENPHLFLGVKKPGNYGNLSVSSIHDRTRAFVKIQDGCDHFCAFCRVPFVRGRSRSREALEVIKEVKKLVDQGSKEIVLTGIDLGSYGRDQGRKEALADLLLKLGKISKLRRLRLSSINPNDITDDLIDAFSAIPNFCEHLHIPLQSGSNHILELMRRPYTIDFFMDRIKKIKMRFPMLAFTADMMVGYPGETDEDFMKSMQIARRVGFMKMHIFRYSPRKETLATRSNAQKIPSTIVKERANRLSCLEGELSLLYRKRFLGLQQEVLVESNDALGGCEGLTSNYIRVYFKGSLRLQNRLVEVNLENIYKNGCSGVINGQI